MRERAGKIPQKKLHKNNPRFLVKLPMPKILAPICAKRRISRHSVQKQGRGFYVCLVRWKQLELPGL